MTTKFPDWSGVDTAALVVSGILVVFVALVVIIAFIWVMGKIMNRTTAKQSKEVPAEKVPAAPTAAPAVTAAAPVEEGISDEVVAAISAAISAVMMAEGNTKPFAIRSIKRVKEARSAWNAAGVMDNTRPF